jgi:hypothetical protein
MDFETFTAAVVAIVTKSDRLAIKTDPVVLALEDQTEVSNDAKSAVREEITGLRAEIDTLEQMLQ